MLKISHTLEDKPAFPESNVKCPQLGVNKNVGNIEKVNGLLAVEEVL